jgi:hypothetical protein
VTRIAGRYQMAGMAVGCAASLLVAAATAAKPLSVLPMASQDPWNPYPIRGPHMFNVKDYGAVGDNSTVDTLAIQRAIDAAAGALAAGGGDVGYVRVPPGGYLVGTVNLTSNVYLVLESGAVLQGSSDPQHYSYDWDFWHVVQGVNVSNTGIIGATPFGPGDLGGELRGSMCVVRCVKEGGVVRLVGLLASRCTDGAIWSGRKRHRSPRFTTRRGGAS